MPYQQIKELPDSIRAALNEIGYNRQDISIEVRESTSLRSGASDGARAFACLVDMTTGKREVTWGSWGGSNMFTQTVVDDCNKSFAVPHNVAVIVGEKGGHGCFAYLFISPSNAAALLTTQEVNLTERELKILSWYKSYTSAYRKQNLEASKVTKEELAALVNKGYLAKKGSGLGITTEGKNALGDRQAY